MNRQYTPVEMLVAALVGAASALLLVFATGLGSSTTVVQQPAAANQQPAKITVNVQAPPAVKQLPQSNTQTDPYGVPQYGVPAPADLHACNLATTVVTMDGQFIPINPEQNVGNTNVSCVLTDTNSDYSVIIDVQPQANADNYYSSLHNDEHNPQLPAGMSMGAITYPDFGIGAPNVSLAYQYAGSFSGSGSGSYQTVVFLATGSSGSTYLVTATLEQTFDNLSQGNIGQLVGDVALSLP